MTSPTTTSHSEDASMTTETSNARGEWVGLLERAVPFLHDEGAKYDDDGSNEPLELAREIETILASLPAAVDEVVRAAVLAEREACARACDDRAAYYHAGDDDGPVTRRGIACEACASVI